jgi:flavin-dependent dehydrogenase
VGDAAGFFDPFTGEGIYRALRGARILAEQVDRAPRPTAGPIELGAEYALARRAAFRSRERLTALIQLFVQTPALMNYAIGRLRRRPQLGALLSRVLGDLEPAESVLRPAFLYGLLRP